MLVSVLEKEQDCITVLVSAMSSASSSCCALCCQAPPDHPGRMYYKCKNHGVRLQFWNWELEYIGYLIENNYIQGGVVVEALGWAKERREELEPRKQEARVTSMQGQEQHVMMLLVEVRQIVVHVKIAVGDVCAMCYNCCYSGEEVRHEGVSCIYVV